MRKFFKKKRNAKAEKPDRRTSSHEVQKLSNVVTPEIEKLRAYNDKLPLFTLSKDMFNSIFSILPERERYFLSRSSYRLSEIFKKQPFLRLENPAQVFNYQSCSSYFSAQQVFGKKSSISAATQLCDGRLLLAYHNGLIEVSRVVDIDPNDKKAKKKYKGDCGVECIQLLKGHKEEVYYLQQVGPTKFVSCDKNGLVFIWNIEGDEIKPYCSFSINGSIYIRKSETEPTPMSFCLLDEERLLIASEETILVKNILSENGPSKTELDNIGALRCVKKSADNKLYIVFQQSLEFLIKEYDLVTLNHEDTEPLEAVLKVFDDLFLRERSTRTVSLPDESFANYPVHAKLNRFGELVLFQNLLNKGSFILYQEAEKKYLKKGDELKGKHLDAKEISFVSYRMTESGKLLFWANSTNMNDENTELRVINFHTVK